MEPESFHAPRIAQISQAEATKNTMPLNTPLIAKV
jgi:hypothetical protein